MKRTTARRLAGAYLVAALVFTTWPGFLPFSRIEPFILGMPFSMAWIAGWVAGVAIVLALLDRVERRDPDGRALEREGAHHGDAR